MKVEVNNSYWRNALHFGPFIEWQEWNIWHWEFTIGFSLGPWDFGLKISLWDILETVEMLKSRGMSADEAWEFLLKVNPGAKGCIEIRKVRK